MNRRSLLSGFMAVVCLATVSGVFVRLRELTGLRAERARLLSQFAARSGPSRPAQETEASPNAAATPSDAPPVSLELLRLRNDVARLAGRRRELAGVRAENERLSVQLAARGTNSSSGTLPPGYVRKTQARLVGYNTPEDTIQSFLWAVQSHDFTNLLQALTPAAAQRLREQAEQSGRSGEEFFRGSGGLPGMGILNRKQLSDGSIELTVEVAPGVPPETFRFRQINSQWKIESPF